MALPRAIPLRQTRAMRLCGCAPSRPVTHKAVHGASAADGGVGPAPIVHCERRHLGQQRRGPERHATHADAATGLGVGLRKEGVAQSTAKPRAHTAGGRVRARGRQQHGVVRMGPGKLHNKTRPVMFLKPPLSRCGYSGNYYEVYPPNILPGRRLLLKVQN